jgi:enamine deaminase RidA (YjgF/YER057c/UK114 family)
MTSNRPNHHDIELTVVNPPELGRPRGFAHGVVTPAGGRVLRIAGQTAVDAGGRVIGDNFVEQFDAALKRVLVVARTAGATAEHIARMTIYVTDMTAYRDSRSELRSLWQQQMGAHYPAMVLVQVVALVDEGALVEIEAEAALP